MGTIKNWFNKEPKKPKAYHILPRLKRVVDSCDTDNYFHKKHTEQYLRLALERYDWGEMAQGKINLHLFFDWIRNNVHCSGYERINEEE